MAITSDELNFLVYRYLHESGFRHSAFTFGSESLVAKSNINGAKIPPGQLINLIQKGLMYTELERSVAPDGEMVGSSEPFQQEVGKGAKTAPREGGGKDKTAKSEGGPPAKKAKKAEKAEGGGGAEGESAGGSSDGVTTLSGHTSEVFICAWSPTTQQLASGSGDSTARIWNLPAKEGAKQGAPSVLQHFSSEKEKSKDVTTLDWNPTGTMLATGSYDGQARIWSAAGKLIATLAKHKGPIFSLKWNASGSYILTGSVDKTAVIWDASTGAVRQQFAFHTEATLDVDWRDEDSFASCSTDKIIYVCKLGQASYVKKFVGHEDEVNAIKWDPSGTLLASCSDDCTAKVWSVGAAECSHSLREHTKEIYTIRWSPTGKGSKNGGLPLVLASASFDSTIRLWDPLTGKCLQVLDKHSDPVYSVAFSPDGLRLASGSFDRTLHIWNVKDGTLTKTHKGAGGIFEVCWNAQGSKVAACFSNNTVCVVDVKEKA